MGIVGAVVIARWAWSLMRVTASVLLDQTDDHVAEEIRELVEQPGDASIIDLHVWQVGPGHFAAIVSLMAREPKEPAHYKALLAHIHELSHVTVEVQPAAA